MCMQANHDESCKLNATVSALGKRVDAIEIRIDSIESTTKNGFSSVNANIETLSQQITNMDKRIIEEKQKWGGVLRKITLGTAFTILSLAALAAGLNIVNSLAPHFFGK